MSLRRQISEAVRDELNAGNFSVPFTATVTLYPRYELSDLVSLHVTVVPTTLARERLTRTEDKVEVTIEVGIQQQVDLQDANITDRLDGTTEDIAAYLLGSKVVIGNLSFVCQTAGSIIVDPESIDEQSVFSGLVSATYQGAVPRSSF